MLPCPPKVPLPNWPLFEVSAVPTLKEEPGPELGFENSKVSEKKLRTVAFSVGWEFGFRSGLVCALAAGGWGGTLGGGGGGGGGGGLNQFPIPNPMMRSLT